MALPRSVLSILGLEKAKTVAFAREHERFATQNLNCSLGTVLDLSAGGARVQFKDKPAVGVGDIAHVSVGSIAYDLRLRSQVMWVRRCGWKNWQCGVRFLGVDEPTAKALVELARFGRVSKPTPVSENVASPAGTGAAHEQKRTGAHSTRVEFDDLYSILNVQSSASEAEIHAAFRALARQLHPDHNSSPDAASRFAEVSKAYKALRDPETRARYDALRQAG